MNSPIKANASQGRYVRGFKCLLAMVTFLLMTAVAVRAQKPGEAVASDFNEEYYRQFSYTWVDDNGVSHTSNITEPATEYNQIVALLREVYINPLIPGFVRDKAWNEIDTPDDPNIYVNVPYEPCLGEGNPYGMTADMKIETPVEGATALIVELKDDYVFEPNSTCENELRKIKAVKLLTKQLYAGPEGSPNPGYLFNYVGALDNFFIITKGCNRIAKNSANEDGIKVGHAPFYNMYEEFSPSNRQPIYDAYTTMDGGQAFYVDHNCTTVMGQNHIIVMSPEGSHHNYPVNFMFYLPDYRFAGDSRTDGHAGPYEWYTYYNEAHKPFFFFNKITARITEAPRYFEKDLFRADVKVEWESTYNKLAGYPVYERFYVYRVVNDVIQPEPVTDYEIAEGYDITRLEDGSMVTKSDRCAIRVREPRHQLAYDVHYIVKGRRYLTDFELVESNIVTANILGYEGSQSLRVVIDGNPVSKYDLRKQTNNYSHTIKMLDTASDGLNCLLKKHLRARSEEGVLTGTTFRLMRYTDDITKPEKVASLEIIDIEPDRWGQWLFKGEVTYATGADTNGAELQTTFKSMRVDDDPVRDAIQPVVAIDRNNGALATFRDNFAVSTAAGTHATAYHYFIVYDPAVLDAAGDLTTTVSNVVDFAVPVNTLKVGYVPYSESQILADSDYATRLPENTPGIQFETTSNPNVARYTVYNVAKNIRVARAQRMPTGQYVVERIEPDGSYRQYTEPGVVNPASPAVAMPWFADIADQFALVLEYTNGNTYGNRIRNLRPLPFAYIYDVVIRPTATNANGDASAYKTVVNWNSQNLDGPADEPYEYFLRHGYRTWGKHDAADDHYVIYGYERDNIGQQRIAPDNRSEIPDQGDFISHEYHFNTHEATFDNPVTYHANVRLYARLPRTMLISNNLDEGYVVSDNDESNSLHDYKEIQTGVDDIIGDTDPDAPVQYFNLQGVPVNDPVPGTIVIRRQGDKVTKVRVP